ncbi:hypothetical protein QZH41_012336 [Actinostola sp. cb2023]|nr:hypothetical protein QZH41_012336 [Actinostola sp. cb2023]
MNLDCLYNFISFGLTDPNAPAQIRQVNLSPTPVVLREGQKITISGSASVQGVVGVNYKIKLNIQKKAWFWVKIPCISKVGSCTYSGITCQKIWQELNQPAQCPLKTGIHALPRQTITIPAVNLPSFLTSVSIYSVRLSASNRRIR